VSELSHIVHWPRKRLFRSSALSRTNGQVEKGATLIEQTKESLRESLLLSASLVLLLLDLLKGSGGASPAPPSQKNQV
jgi:hypothetical protein